MRWRWGGGWVLGVAVVKDGTVPRRRVTCHVTWAGTSATEFPQQLMLEISETPEMPEMPECLLDKKYILILIIQVVLM